MKFKVIVLGLVSVLVFSCNSSSEQKDSEESSKAEEKVILCKYRYDSESTIVGWEAFKTTAKKGVKGVFNKVDVLAPNSSEDLLQTLSGATFSLPVSGINSENEARDFKLENSFFGNMIATDVVSGLVRSINETNATVEISMNGVTIDYTGNVSVQNNTVRFDVEIDLLDFEATTAIDSLNVVCGELHKGDDGISKLWSVVSISVETTLKEECE